MTSIPVPKQKGQAASGVSFEDAEVSLARESLSELDIIRKCLPPDLSDEVVIAF